MGKSGSHWVCIILDDDKYYYFDSFGVRHIPIEIKRFIGDDRYIETNNKQLQDISSVMCGYYCISFIDHILDGGNMDSYLDMFGNDFKTNDKIVKKMFM